MNQEDIKKEDVETPRNHSTSQTAYTELPRSSLVSSDGRDRWSSRMSFILAAIGSAIGLGNFWRFPYLVYKHGGGVFLIPYTLALFIIGIPLLQLEITIGQIIQKGSIHAFMSISPMLCGIGFAAVFVAFMIASYYSMIIAWIFSYFVKSFKSTLPWNGLSNCVNDKHQAFSNAEYHLYYNVLSIWKKNPLNETWSQCSFRDQEDNGGIQWETFGYMVIIWVLIYFCVYKGVHHTSKIVYFTVISPILLLFILFGRAITLDGAEMGIKAYIYEWDFTKLANADIWVDAISQIFFSLSVALGIMISFGSYNSRTKPVVQDAFIIAISNGFFSFLSGFVVMGTLGYYAHVQGTTIDQLPEANLKSLALVFITYPTALNELSYSHAWCAIFFFTLLMLGIDSVFSLIEGILTCLEDTSLNQKFSRPILLLGITIPSLSFGIFYCQYTGLYWFDVVDHYGQYLMLIIGIAECYSIGWILGWLDSSIHHSNVSSLATSLYTIGYTIGSVGLIIFTISFANLFRTSAELQENKNGRIDYEILIGGMVFLVCFLCFSWLSYRKAQKPWLIWLKTLGFAGPQIVTEYWMSFSSSKSLNHETNECYALGKGNLWADYVMSCYCYFWCWTIKYFVPISISLLLFVGIRLDILFRYGKYIDQYQILGWLIVLGGFICIFLPIIFFDFKPKFHESFQFVFEQDEQTIIQRKSSIASIQCPI